MEINISKEMQDLFKFSILNIDKPSGPTSFTISDYIHKQLKEFGVTKTSHFGTLDPKVTGVLPIALSRGCKLTGFFLGHDKTYVGIMRVSEETTIEKVQDMIDKHFTGKIKQLPPVKSRVKREERVREIMEFKILERSKSGKDFLFISKVQGGTYIRKLCHDLGEKMGFSAHMLELRRTRAGIFSEDDKTFIDLYEFDSALDEFKCGKPDRLKKLLVPGQEALKQVMPVVEVKKSSLKQLLTGKPIYKNDLVGSLPSKKEGEIFAVFCKNDFIEVATSKIKSKKHKDIVAKSLFVFN